jgi:hypothetical protein
MMREHEEGSVESIIAGALSAPDFDNLAAEYAQLGSDKLLDSDIVSDVPVVRCVVAVVRTGIGIRDRLFARSAIDRVPAFEIKSLRLFCEIPETSREAPVPTLQNLHMSGLLNAVSGWGALVYSPNEVSGRFSQWSWIG